VISIEDIIIILSSYIKYNSNNVAISILNKFDEIADYSISSNFHPLCKVAKNDKFIGSKCRQFYRSIHEGAGDIVCPYGFTIRYVKIDIGENDITLCSIINFCVTKFTHELDELSRKSKKTAAQSMLTPHTINCEESELFFEKCFDIINALISGRVATSIRGLSHHILTPIQGLISDIESTDIIFKDEGLKRRLKFNANEIFVISKRIQLLLAEQSEFNAAKIRRVCLHAEINKIIDQLNYSIDRRRISFNHGYNSVCEAIEAIPDQINIVIQNLLQNALKYSFNGFEDKHAEIRISYKLYEKTNIEVVISNLGCGITESEISSGEIFKLGYRGELSGDRGRDGSGCGLYTSNLIVRAHGGSINIVSYPIGSGNSFEQVYKNDISLILPITQSL
jgi:K+-sensing histidine kinase KdpD